MRPPVASRIVSSVVVVVVSLVAIAITRLLNPIAKFEGWQARRESNPQPPVLETGALPIELLAFVYIRHRHRRDLRTTSIRDVPYVSGRSGRTCSSRAARSSSCD